MTPRALALIRIDFQHSHIHVHCSADVQHKWFTKNMRRIVGESVMVNSTFGRVFQFDGARDQRQSTGTN